MYWGDNYDLVQISEEAYKKKEIIYVWNILKIDFKEKMFLINISCVNHIIPVIGICLCSCSVFSPEGGAAIRNKGMHNKGCLSRQDGKVSTYLLGYAA